MSENSPDKPTEKDNLSKKRSRSNRHDDTPFNDLLDSEICIERVAKVSPKIAEATMDDVEITPEATNPLKRINKKKKSRPTSEKDFTKLVSIMGIPTYKLKLDELRSFLSRHNLTGGRKGTKKVVCDILANKKEFPGVKKVETKTEKRSYVNPKRFCNVILSDAIRPLFATRGEPLSKDDLRKGLKTDEILHRNITKEYNNPEKHNTDAHPRLQNCGGDPSKLTGQIQWDQSSKTFKDLTREYENSFYNWKLLANHGGFGEANPTEQKPFSDFIPNNQSLLYLREFVYRFPNAFKTTTGGLPEGMFYESIIDRG